MKLGFNSNNLVCKTCSYVRNIDIESECLKCCKNKVTGNSHFEFAVLELDSRVKRQFPAIAEFLKEDLENFGGKVEEQQSKGVYSPRLLLFKDKPTSMVAADDMKRIGGWERAEIVEFLEDMLSS